jgi:hypothetical protein
MGAAKNIIPSANIKIKVLFIAFIVYLCLLSDTDINESSESNLGGFYLFCKVFLRDLKLKIFNSFH